MPDLDAYVAQFVCPIITECAGLVVGSEDHQHSVLHAFLDLARTFNIDHGQGYVLRALLGDDPWTAMRLAEGFDAYNAALERVRAALDALPSLHSTDV